MQLKVLYLLSLFVVETTIIVLKYDKLYFEFCNLQQNTFVVYKHFACQISNIENIILNK